MKIDSWVEALFLLDFLWMGKCFGCCYFRFSTWYAWYLYFHFCLVFFFSLLPRTTLPVCLVLSFFFPYTFFNEVYYLAIYIYIYIMKWSLCIKWWKKIGLHSNWAYIYIYILVARKIHHCATGWKKLILMGNFWTELMQCILATWLVYSSTWALVTINKLVLVVTKVV